ncbi:MAG: hypothetical protein ACE5Q6_14230, partial [Dehalococcoidia bacterium]
SEYCLMHSPKHAEAMAEARRLGGRRRRREVTVAEVYEFCGLESVTDIRRLLQIAVLDTLGLENSIARSRTLAYLAMTAAKLLETGEFEQRLAALEDSVQGQKAPPESVFDAHLECPGFSDEEINEKQ